MTTVASAALTSSLNPWSYLTNEGHTRSDIVTDVYELKWRLSTDMVFSSYPTPGSGLHQAAILPCKLRFSCNMSKTLQQTPS
jgi:hypothetical protein